VPTPPGAGRSRARWITAVVAALVVLGVAATAAAVLVSQPASSTSSPSASTPSTPAFTDPGSHFSVAFPVTPISQSETLPVDGSNLTITEYVATVSSTDQYEAGYVLYPDSVDTSNPSVNLAGAVQGAVTSTGGTLLSQSQGTYQGFPSVDFLLSAAGEYIDYRVVLDGHSLYQVAVASTVNPPANFTSFASSLKILAP
jgi:hypothetical protein